MKRARRLSQRLVRWTSLCVCFALVISSFVLFPSQATIGKNSIAPQGRSGSPNGKGRKVDAPAPRPGPPEATLPNLDEVRRKRHPRPEAPMHIPSSVRPLRNPVKPWDGIRVGDPLPSKKQAAVETIRSGSRQPVTAEIDRMAVMTVTNESAHNDRRKRLAGRSLRAKEKSHHPSARARSRAFSPPPLADDQYVQNFFYWALLRYPNGSESTYWNDILRTAYAHGTGSVILAVRELGHTLFESSEYAARARSDRDYVYDLYKTYLYRDPDQGGWDYWTSVVPSNGRENVRRAFDLCGELANLLSTLTPNGGISSAVSSLLSARVDPINEPGSGLLGRPAEWSVPLLSLPGRAGLDLGLTLSYSSTVWTRSGPYLYFNEDNGWPGPGFRLGFPTIQETSFDAQVGQNAYVMMMPSGRVELRQVGTSNTYEAADSSYLQLVDYGSSLVVRTTDGTQLTYGPLALEYRCTQIKDRNGNYVSVNYDGWGHILNITDTLGRVINFNYDSYANLLSITQSWNGQTHNWATFGWSTLNMQLGFSGVSVVGTYSGETIPVLTQVGLDDGSYFTFQYTGAGQVNLIRRYTSDNVQRAYTAYDYATTLDDCPRIIDTRVWADNWTGLNGVPAEVVTQFSEPGDGSHQMVAPDGTVYKEFYGTGWQKGLTTQSEVWSGGVRQKWTTTAWTQDNTSVNYQTNPRVTETNIYDAAGNRRRTTITYYPTTSFSLPSDVYEYASDGVTLLRQTHTNYHPGSVYTDRRIIGLVTGKYVFDGSGVLQSFFVFDYDYGGAFMSDTSQPATQHDPAYGPSFIAGRGNLSLVRRTNAADPANAPHDAVFAYNTTGSVTSTTDPLWHQTNFSYADSFSDSVNRNTFAYPTTVTDPDGYGSSVQYNFDFGAKTSAQGPPPAGQSQGVIQTIAYDSAARMQQVTTVNTGAYTRYVYGPNYMQSFSSVNNVADDAYAISVFDGLGRSMGTVTNHPGSVGGYRMVGIIYDLMGRAVKQSNPTEINGSWVPSGDDASGVFYTQQTYDWKGRPLVTTNTDGTQKYASYSACGCAGSEVATLTDEVGRQQKVYSDVLGRTAKTEVLNWDGSVYAAMVNTYNARDQVTQVRQFQGNDQSGVYQDTTMSYDGYGRLQTKHVPEQDANTATVYAYNSDDTVSSATDARGASATYGYNNRHQATSINYNAPAGITATSNVTYAYDGAGNRTSMTDGLGSKTYTYNQLSQVMSETRTFNGVGTFTLSYDYNLGGELKKITDATNMTIDYAFDSTGRLSGVTGSDSLYANVSNYASNFQYRAWGGLKAMTDGKGFTSSLLYNSKLQPTHFEISGNTVSQNYDYYNDGRISFVHNVTDATFDRSYTYDHAGRIIEAKSGGQARGTWGAAPYYETFGYDGFANLTARESQSWNGLTDDFDSTSYTNNRRGGWGYDADGRNTTIDTRTNTFDAVGQQTAMSATAIPLIGSSYTVNQAISYDGDAAMSKEVDTQSNAPGYANTTYHLRSSVLGGAIIEEINSSGQKNVGYVYAAGQLLATQQPNNPNMVTWKHNTPAGPTQYTVNTYNNATGRTEFDPLGANLSLTAPEDPPPSEGNGDIGAGHFGGIMDARWSDFFNVSGGCMIDFMAASCSQAMGLVNMGAGVLTDPYQMPATGGAWSPKLGKYIGVGILGWDPFTGLLGYSIFQPKPKSKGDKPGPGANGKVEPQNPAPTEAQRKCDQKLASIFGDEGSVAAGSGFEPPNMPGKENQFRGGPNGHLNNAMHLYGSGDGYGEGGVYIPAGGRYIGKNPYSSEDSYMFYYSRLGNARNVTLFTAHVDNFSAPRGTTTGRTRIGDIGGEGGRSPFNPNSPFNQGPYIHAHLAIHQGRGYTGKRLSFFNTFCK